MMCFVTHLQYHLSCFHSEKLGGGVPLGMVDDEMRMVGDEVGW